MKGKAILFFGLFVVICGSLFAQMPKIPSDWDVNRPLDTETFKYVIGTSAICATEQEAYKSARQDALQQFAQSIATHFKGQIEKRSKSEFYSSEIEDEFTITTSTALFSTEAQLPNINEFPAKPVERKNGRYIVKVLMVMNKAKAIQAYSGKIKTNLEMINKLVDVPKAEKNTFKGFAGYQLAAVLADANIVYGDLLIGIGAPQFAQGLKKGEYYRHEARNIADSIPVGIKVEGGEKSGRIKGAFENVLSEMGLNIGRNNTRYVLEVNVSIKQVPPEKNDKLRAVRIALSAYLVDTKQGITVLHHNFNKEVVQSTWTLAEDSAYRKAELDINENYKKKLSGYLSDLLSKK